MLMCSEKDIDDSIRVNDVIAFFTKDTSMYSRMLLELEAGSSTLCYIHRH